MNITFSKPGAARRELACLIGKITNTAISYAGAPTMAYRIGELTLTRDCVLQIPNGFNNDLLEQVIGQASKAGWDNGTHPLPGVEPHPLRLIFPTQGWDEKTRTNLERLLEAKGALISKALDIETASVEYTDEGAVFKWFDDIPNHKDLQAASALIAAMIKNAKDALRINAKPTSPGVNEKYAMRCWLVRLGFIGKETKQIRATLLARLEGNSAWRHVPKTKQQ